eukprot:TRINITY_DN22376_c0_g1_i1.p1 TRINITY_DN22376_c0_g1~~TRINITY_DN22376_c0_g1_i1.p1  ORF type:complete len:385 (+),score=132.34 TRINITY_DN22376_c0_g1_i1:42-1196(+)
MMSMGTRRGFFTAASLHRPPLRVCSEESVRQFDFVRRRDGETRVWEAVRYLDAAPATGLELQAALQRMKAEHGVRYVLLGIPEDVGPRANEGRGGCDQGWFALLYRLLNLQANRFFPPRVGLLGEVDLSDVTASVAPSARPSLEALRLATAAVDAAVEPVMHAVFAAGLEPIVIGGGHNNAYPILRALHHASGEHGVVAGNLDAHADFRAPEGRHSGNPFRYAHDEGVLKGYHVVGLHEYKNNEESLAALDAAGYTYDSYQKLRVRREVDYRTAVAAARDALDARGLPLGVEVDVDAVSNVPASASTAAGLTVADAEEYVHLFSRARHARYLHVAEAAPQVHCVSLREGLEEGGQVLAALVMAYIMGRERALAVRDYRKAVTYA